MKFVKSLLFFFLFFLLLVQNGLARIGIGISPASGTFNFTLDGGTIDFAVYNTGDSDMNYTISISGTAINFTTIEPKKAEIKANSYAIFKAIINPTREVKTGETYTLIATAKAVSPGAVAVGAESRINLYFYGERTKPYEEIPYLLYAVIGIGSVVALMTVYFVYKKFRRREALPHEIETK